jgi:hypothetical protein
MIEHFTFSTLPLSSATVSCRFRAVYSGHKLATPESELKEASPCKVLGIKRKLVAGGRLELPTLGL